MKSALRLLLIEDVEDDALLLARELRLAGYDLVYERVQTPEGVTEALDRSSWDVVVSDHGMPSFSGTEALNIVRQKAPDLPFIFLSGSIGEDIAVSAMLAGAQDYVMKGNLKRLAPAIARELHDSQGRRRERIALERLRATNEVLRSVFAASPLAIVATDLAGRVKVWNPAAERLFGWTESEILGKHDPSIPSTDQVATDARRTAVLRGDPIASLEVQRERRDGSTVQVNLSIAATYDRSGIPDGITVVLQDLTERKELEAQFLQAQKMEAVGQLAGGIAHDFNNLLTVVSSYSELLLLSMSDDDPRAVDVGEIKKAGERATALTRQLLAFSRRQVILRRVIGLNGVASDATNLLRRLIDENIDLRINLGQNAGVVTADPSQIEQVIMNLVVNARDAMINGGVIEIETRHANASELEGEPNVPVAPRGFAVLSVSDTGTGMDATTQARIFEPFFTTKAVDKGTGLGLATVYGIVKQHDGVIRVQSAPGVGTTFHIYLPSAEERRATPRLNIAIDATRQANETVLIVEGEASLRSVARRALVAAGYTVLAAVDWHDALHTIEQHTGMIHLMVTDVTMPGLGGASLAKRFMTARPGARVLFASGYIEDTAELVEIIESNHGLITKPYTPAALVRAVKQTLT